MKKILGLFIFLFIGNVVVAQQVRFGFKGGLNVATLAKIKNVEPKMAFHFGAMTEFQINDALYVQPELLFSVQGVEKIEKNGLDNSVRLSYLTIPFMAKYYLRGGLCVEAGPYVAFNISANQGKEDYQKDLSEDINGLDYGAGIGLNYILPNTLSFGVRYNVGMTEVFNGKQKGSRNEVLQVSIGWFL